MAVIGLVMTAATATTGVVAGPQLAQTVENRLNVTPEPTVVPTDTPVPAVKPTAAPKPPTPTRVPPKASVSPTTKNGGVALHTVSKHASRRAGCRDTARHAPGRCCQARGRPGTRHGHAKAAGRRAAGKTRGPDFGRERGGHSASR
jgi:hypothetical protein